MENVATISNNSGVKTRSKTRQENVNSKMPGNSSSTSSVPRKDKPTARPQGKQETGQPLDVSENDSRTDDVNVENTNETEFPQEEENVDNGQLEEENVNDDQQGEENADRENEMFLQLSQHMDQFAKLYSQITREMSMLKKMKSAPAKFHKPTIDPMRQKPCTRLEFTSVTNFIKSAVALDAELELLEFSERQKVSSLVLCIPSAKMTILQRVISEKGGYDQVLFDDVLSALFCSLTRSNVAESLQLIKQNDSTIQEFNIEFKNAVKFLKMQDDAFAQLVLKTYKDSLSPLWPKNT